MEAGGYTSEEIMTEEQRLSLVKQRKKSFAELIRLFFVLNVPQITSVSVTEDLRVEINGSFYKLDVDDYTGSRDEDGYIFYNTSSGRIYVEKGGKGKVYKLEVELFDE